MTLYETLWFWWRHRRWLALCGGLGLLGGAVGAAWQGPEAEGRMVVSFGPGGQADQLAEILKGGYFPTAPAVTARVTARLVVLETRGRRAASIRLDLNVTHDWIAAWIDDRRLSSAQQAALHAEWVALERRLHHPIPNAQYWQNKATRLQDAMLAGGWATLTVLEGPEVIWRPRWHVIGYAAIAGGLGAAIFVGWFPLLIREWWRRETAASRPPK